MLPESSSTITRSNSHFAVNYTRFLKRMTWNCLAWSSDWQAIIIIWWGHPAHIVVLIEIWRSLLETPPGRCSPWECEWELGMGIIPNWVNVFAMCFKWDCEWVHSHTKPIWVSIQNSHSHSNVFAKIPIYIPNSHSSVKTKPIWESIPNRKSRGKWYKNQ